MPLSLQYVVKNDVRKLGPKPVCTWSEIHGVTIAPSLPNVEHVPTPADLNQDQVQMKTI